MADVPESTYHRAFLLLDDAKEYLPVGGAIPEEGGDPIGYAQALATAGLGHAILALCDELRSQRES
jgi:hypothetical protein